MVAGGPDLLVHRSCAAARRCDGGLVLHSLAEGGNQRPEIPPDPIGPRVSKWLKLFDKIRTYILGDASRMKDEDR